MPIAVVTGSSSGIGRATALELAELGFDLVLHARRNLSGLQATARQLGRKRQVLAITADIACPAGCRDLVSAAFAWRGHIDAWINNAGVDVLTTALRDKPFEERLDSLLRVDVCGTIRISRLVAERMRGQTNLEGCKPCIINMGWDQAQTGMEGTAGQLFCTSKAAVEAFTRALALSVGPSIRVNAVAPGWIKTSWGQETSDYWNRRAQAESMLQRWGNPEDVAATIGWLTGPRAEFVNGQVIAVNGGFQGGYARTNCPEDMA